MSALTALAIILTAFFVAVKTLGYVEWTWVAVFIPLMIYICVLVVLGIIGAISSYIGYRVVRRED